MAKSKLPKDQSERDRYTVVLEDVQSKLQLLSEGQEGLRQQTGEGLQRLESRMNDRFVIVEQAIRENSQRIQENSQRIQENSQGIQENSQGIRENSQAIRETNDRLGQTNDQLRQLNERFDTHLKEHAAT